MIAGRKLSVALVLMMTATSFTAFLPAAGSSPTPILTVTKEWTGGPYNSTPAVIINDTDGDGHNEMVVWLSSSGRGPGGGGSSEYWVKVYDLPNYTLAWSLNLTGSFGLELADLGHNGSVEFLLEEYGYDYENFTAISGKDYSTLWTSPDFGGSIYDTQIIDVDADGDLELVFVNQTYMMDNMSQTSDTRLQVYNAATGNKEWESAVIDEMFSSWEIANIDSDAALEILYVGQSTFKVGASSTLSVYDGATGALGWTFGGPGFSSISILYHGNVDQGRSKEVVVEADTSDGNSSAAGVHVLAGADGSDIWNISFENATIAAEAEDINNDSVIELLVTEFVMDMNTFDTNQTFFIFELKGHKELWSLGPFTSSIMKMGSSYMTAQDLTGDGVPEVVVTKESLDLVNFTYTHTFDVYDSKDFSLLWSSPELSGYDTTIDALPLDSDNDWEIVLPESWTDQDQNDHGIVHVYSTASWTEEWKSEDYGAQIDSAVGLNAVNDSRPELLVELVKSDMQNGTSTNQLLIIDSDTHYTLFTSP